MINYELPKSPLLALLVAPMLGGLFVVFLPFVGFFMIGRLVVIKLGQLARQRSSRPG